MWDSDNPKKRIFSRVNTFTTSFCLESKGLFPTFCMLPLVQHLLAQGDIDMTGKVCMITGGNSGIGKATALGLAKLNASVVIVSRDKDKGEATLIEMRAKSGNRNLDAMTADLSSQDSVRELAHDFKARY